jgi:DNA primase
MNAQEIKEFILENNKIEEILEEIECHSIKPHSDYWTCGNKNGDNRSAITIYRDNLHVENYTRILPKPSDIITLIQYNKDINFFQALKWLHEFLNLDLYREIDRDIPESLKITKMLLSMKNKGSGIGEDDTPIKPISEEVLKYYDTPCVNDMFLKDGISYNVQELFSIGYDEESNRLTIPIFDEFDNLVSVKGRTFKYSLTEEESEFKYLYLYKCPRNKILFGLNKTISAIKEKNLVYVAEAEKGVLQLVSYGYGNCVATGGEKVSKHQIEKLSRLAVDICFAFDKDVSQEKIENIAGQFIDGINVYAIYDTDNLLKEKQSPSDNKEIFEQLIKNNIYKIR